jgi:hypothetical protein
VLTWGEQQEEKDLKGTVPEPSGPTVRVKDRRKPYWSWEKRDLDRGDFPAWLPAITCRQVMYRN